MIDVFITGGDIATGGLVENNVFEKLWESTGRISNSAYAFHFRNGGSPSPDPNDLARSSAGSASHRARTGSAPAGCA